MSLSRWIGFADDPTSGGSTYEVLTAGTPVDIPVPTMFTPATGAQVDFGQTPLARTDEVRGKRGDTAPVSFLAAPKWSVDARAYPVQLRKLLRNALGGAITHAGGAAPKAYEDTVVPLEEGLPPMLVAWLKREGQLDRATGLIVSELAMNFPIDQEGSFTASLDALYSQVQPYSSAKEPGGSAKAAKSVSSADYSADVETFKLRDGVVLLGSSEVEIPNLGGFSVTFNNGLIEETRAKFKPGHNIEKTTLESVVHKLWYPQRHKLGPQTVTGKFELSEVDPTQELKKALLHAEKLIFRVAAGPLGTTPPAEEMLQLTIGQMARTGGGAEPLVRQGDQFASYDFTGYISTSGETDIEGTFIGATALT
jgi:hypothetical protein